MIYYICISTRLLLVADPQYRTPFSLIGIPNHLVYLLFSLSTRPGLSPDCDPDLQCGAGWETGCLSRGGGHLHLYGE